MEILIPTLIYIVVVSDFIVRMLRNLFLNGRKWAKNSALFLTIAFIALQCWAWIPFIQNENGKSFTVGWYALAYFSVLSFTSFAILCWLMVRVAKRIAI